MNYNLSVEVGKIPGARVMDIQGRTGARACVVIPIDNERGMCVDSYEVFDHKIGGMVWRPLRHARLNLKALECADKRYGSTHFLKPSFSREFYQSIAEEDRRNIPIVGNMKEMPTAGSRVTGSSANDGNLGAGEDW